MTLWTVDDVAKALVVTKGTVYQMVRDGRLVAVRLGRSVRFDPADVGRAIRRSKTEPAPRRRKKRVRRR